MNPGETLSGKYEIVRELGRGGAGITYLARETATGRDVVVKLLHLGLLGDWKTVELFEREAAVLRDLHHPCIPAYVDFFREELEGMPQFVLVREFVDGQSLQARVEAGWRATEQEIRDVGVRLANIVSYIHSVRPPVIHRDINPRNTIQRIDGEIFLLDFGGVQDAIRLSMAVTNTIVGTPGYTPMEQFVGRASVRSDLYAVAATLLFLLTHRNPADLPVKEMKVDFASVIEISSAGLARVLGNWLEPDESKRTLSIDDAIALLEHRVQPPAPQAQRAQTRAAEADAPGTGLPLDRPPSGSRILRSVEGDAVRFLIPGGGMGRGIPAFGGFVFFWIMFGGFWSSSSFRSGRILSTTLISLPFIIMGLSSISWIVSSLFGKLGIEVGPGEFSWTRRLFFFSRRRSVPLSDVGECRLEEGRGSRYRSRGTWGDSWGNMDRYRRDRGWGDLPRYRSHGRSRSGARLSLDVGVSTLRFGENLSEREREWLRDALNEEIRKARAAQKEID